MSDEAIPHAKGNPGEDPEAEDTERLLTKGGSAEARAIDPFENPDVVWTPDERRTGGD